MTNWVKATSKAKEVLMENLIKNPPIPIIDIVKNYGYEIKEVELSPNIAGFVNPQERIIYVNQSDSILRKTFTIAHELGHILLHTDELNKNPNLGILYRRPLGRKDEDGKEQEANMFAANLLVPFEMLEDMQRKYADLATVDTLSKLFGVSNEVIRYRLHDMELNKKDGN